MAYRLESALANLARLATRESPPPLAPRRAAVLIALFEGDDGQVQVLLTRRSSALRAHGGQVSLPGGKRDEVDEDDVATALREAHEELDLRPRDVRVLGCLQPLLSPHLLSVTPVVGVIERGQVPRLTPSPDEVAAVFGAPLGLFTDPGDRHSHRDVVYHADLPYRIHSFEHQEGAVPLHPATPPHEVHLIWGFTAALLIRTARLAFQREPAFQVHHPAVHPSTMLRVGPEGEVVAFRAGGAQ